MAQYGPPPKRSDQRRRRNAPNTPPTVEVAGAAPQPDLGVEGMHPIAADWYASLGDSVESRYYTPAIWQRARITARVLSDILKAGRPSAQMYAAVQQDMKALMVDAAELRRLGIEVQAADAEAGPVDNVIDWRARAATASSS